MEHEVRPIEVLFPDKRIETAEFWLYEEDFEIPDNVILSLKMSGDEFNSSNTDFFEAMCDIRRHLEKMDMLLLCYGSSRNVFPSSMSRSMGYGVKAYRLVLGEPARTNDLVSIFDSGPDISPVSVDEQKHFYHTWLTSLGHVLDLPV